MSSSQYKYSAVMATETGQLVEGKTAKEEEASIIQDVSCTIAAIAEALLRGKFY